MKMNKKTFVLVILVAGLGRLSVVRSADYVLPEPPTEYGKFTTMCERILPLHTRLDQPEPGEWLFKNHEKGQSYKDYVTNHPTTARGSRYAIYLQPLGKFTRTERETINTVSHFLGHYFGAPVTVNADLPLSGIPDRARRVLEKDTAIEQILAPYILNNLLLPRLPNDAAAYLAVTGSDLWPGEGWRYCYGQASLSKRVGVWSLRRLGDPERSEEVRQRVLLRNLKRAAQTTAHMFSMRHCVYYECNMGGEITVEEADRQPLALCPVCLAKLSYATGVDTELRYRRLAKFCESQGFEREQRFYEASIRALDTGDR